MSKPDLDVPLDDRIKASGARRGGRPSGRGRGGRRGPPSSSSSYGPRRDNRPARRDSRPTPYNRDSYRSSGREGGGARNASNLVAVSNLLPNVDESDLREIFAGCGSIAKATIHFDRHGRSQGTGEVQFSRASEAEHAVREYDAAEVDGRPMYLKLIVSRDVLTSTRSTSSNPFSDQRCFNCNRLGHIAADCRQRRQPAPRTAKANGTENSAEGKDKNACFTCGKAGHFARDCPEAKTQGAGRDRRGRDKREEVKAEDLDADMDDYFKTKKSAAEEEAVPALEVVPEPAAAAEDQPTPASE